MSVAMWSMLGLDSVLLCLLPTKVTLKYTIQLGSETIPHIPVRTFLIFRYSWHGVDI